MLLSYLRFKAFNFIPEGMTLVFLQNVTIFYEKACSYHYIDSIINSSFDVARIIGLTRKVINKYFAYATVLQFSIFFEEFDEFVRDELQSFDFLMFTLILLLKASLGHSIDFRE